MTIPKELRKLAAAVATVSAIIGGTAGFTTGQAQSTTTGGFGVAFSQERGEALEKRVDRMEVRTVKALEQIAGDVRSLRDSRTD